jgi:hypothetical protein
MLRLLVNPANNMSKTNLQQQITVHALPSKVWKVLTGQITSTNIFLRAI